MPTDTAHYRYLGYHTPEGPREKLDYSTLADVTRGLYRMVVSLATVD